MGICSYCGETFEDWALRPYAFDGALTCHPCAHSTPERAAEAERRLEDLLTICIDASPLGSVIISDEGLSPMMSPPGQDN